MNTPKWALIVMDFRPALAGMCPDAPKALSHAGEAGLFTSGVALSALREPADRGFEAVVLADACAGPDQDLHDVAVPRLFPTQATVLNVAAWDPDTMTAKD